MTLVDPCVAGILSCPSCGGDDWGEAPCLDAPSWGTIACRSCERQYVVASGVPLLLRALDGTPVERSRAELVRDGSSVLEGALGRYAELLGGVEEAIDRCEGAPLDHAFAVPDASWIRLGRFSTGKFARVPTLVPTVDTLLDLGCGYGASAVPFLQSGRAKAVIGVDENLLFLLLLRRYCREESLPVPGAACFDLGDFPYPLRDGAAEAVIAISFFNHFASLRPAVFVERFFAELGRLVKPGGTLAVDMVPNRVDPFPRELHLRDVVTSPGLRRRLASVCQRLPLKWIPAAVTVPGSWAAYRGYAALAGKPAHGFAEFRSLLPKAAPDLALGGLPVNNRRYRRLLHDFEQVEILDERRLYRFGEVVPAGRWSRTPYFVLRGTRAGRPVS